MKYLINNYKILSYILILIIFVFLMFSCKSSSLKFKNGDIVCFKLNGNKGIIHSSIGSRYNITYFDTLGKNHYDVFFEEELEYCSK